MNLSSDERFMELAMKLVGFECTARPRNFLSVISAGISSWAGLRRRC